MGGLEATAEIKTALSNVRVIILTLHKTQEYLVASLHAGADGFIQRTRHFRNCAAIRRVQ